MTDPNFKGNTTLFGEAVWYFSAFLILRNPKNFIPRGSLRRYGFIDIITEKDAPAWLAPHRGVADPNRKIKAGTIIIHCPAEKGKEKII